MRVQPFSYLEQKDIGGDVPPGPTLWTPAQISTTVWVDPSDASTVTLDGTNIVSITDKSGNGHDLIQTVSTIRRFTYVTGVSGINNLNAMEGDGTKAMYLDYNVGFETLNWFFVTDIDNTSVSSNQAVTRRGFGSNSLGGTLRYTPSGLGGFYVIGGNGAAITNKSTNILNPSINELLFDYDGSNTDFSAYQDANVFSSPTSYLGTLTNQTDDVKPIIGGAYTSDAWGGTGFSDFFQGRLGEIIWINDSVVTTDTREKIQGYLAWKWGTEGNLPSGHPYKNAAPMV